MSRRPTYNRSPRLIPALPRDEIEIPGPPAKPAPPRPLWMMIMTSGMMAVMILFLGFFTGRSMIFFLPFMLASLVSGFVINRLQQRDYEAATKKRHNGYRSMLGDYKQLLQTRQNQQFKILHQKYPPYNMCAEWANTRNPNLWARTPADDDFLEIRLGIGNRPSTVPLKLPPRDHPFDPDQLIIDAHKMASGFNFVPDAPVTLPLAAVGVSGVVGPVEADKLSLVRALVMQLVTHHAPEELKIVVVYPKEQEKEWDWIRWLPHVWDNNREHRFVANDANTVKPLFSMLNDMLGRRQLHLPDDEKSETIHHPFYFVFILAAPNLVTDEILINRLQTEGPALGAYSIFLQRSIPDLPQQCRAIIQVGVGEAGQTILKNVTPHLIDTPLNIEGATGNAARSFTQAIAPVRLKQISSATLPPRITLLQLYKVETVKKLKIAKRWTQNRDRITNPDSELTKINRFGLSVPIGRQTGDKDLDIDLHELADGPNGLVAGMVGSGKSELLQTLLVSLAINFDPRQLAFVLIDYKGDGMAGDFRNIPHTLGIINNLQDESIIVRAINSFKKDLEKRSRLFKKAGVNHIDDYQKRYYAGQLDKTEFEPMPYLVIVVDEFAEMKTAHTEDAKEFVRIARVGRALGYRLILAMQKPDSNIVDGQIEANTRFRLCLRVAQEADSKAMLKRPDAAYLSHLGRAYFQVGANEKYEEFQTAWSGEEYDPAGDRQDDDQAIKEVYLDGKRSVLYSPKKIRLAQREANRQNSPDLYPDTPQPHNPASAGLNSPAPPTQLKAVLTHLKHVAVENNIEPVEPLWLDPLPDKIDLNDKTDKNRDLLGRQWIPELWRGTADNPQLWLNPIVGLLDDVQNKQQYPLQLNLEKDGNLSIHASPGFGKTTFLQMLITGLIWHHSPEDLNLYLLDFGSRILDMYEVLPHTGAVIDADDSARLTRLLDFLQDEMSARRKQFSQISGAQNLFDYRQRAAASGQPRLPAIIIILDDYDNFSATFDSHSDTTNLFHKIIREGQAVGIYTVLSSSKELSPKIATYINQTAALTLLDSNVYSLIGIGSKDLIPKKTPGRGILKGSSTLEFQIASGSQFIFESGDRDNPANSVVNHMQQAAQTMRNVPRLHAIPEILDLDNFTKIVQSVTDRYSAEQLKAAIGLTVKGLLTPFSVGPALGSSVLVAGPPGSGKTNLLRTWLLAMCMAYEPTDLNLYIFDSKRRGLSAFKKLPHTKNYIATKTDTESRLKSVLDKLGKIVEDRSTKELDDTLSDNCSPLIMIIVDDLFDPAGNILPDEAKNDLVKKVMQVGRNLNFQLLAAGPSDQLAKQYSSDLLRFLKSGSALFLGSEQSENNLGLPNKAKTKETIEPGEGIWVVRNEWSKVKILITPETDELFEQQLKNIIVQYPPPVVGEPDTDGEDEV